MLSTPQVRSGSWSTANMVWLPDALCLFVYQCEHSFRQFLSKNSNISWPDRALVRASFLFTVKFSTGCSCLTTNHVQVRTTIVSDELNGVLILLTPRCQRKLVLRSRKLCYTCTLIGWSLFPNAKTQLSLRIWLLREEYVEIPRTI